MHNNTRITEDEEKGSTTNQAFPIRKLFRSAGKRALMSRISRSLRVTGTDTNRWDTYDFLHIIDP